MMTWANRRRKSKTKQTSLKNEGIQVTTEAGAFILVPADCVLLKDFNSVFSKAERQWKKEFDTIPAEFLYNNLVMFHYGDENCFLVTFIFRNSLNSDGRRSQTKIPGYK